MAASNPGQLIHKIIINNNNNQEQWNQKSRLSYYQWNNDDFHRTATVAPSSTAATATAVEPHAAALSYKPYQSVYSNHQRLSDNPNSGGTSVRESRYYNKLRYSMNFLFFFSKANPKCFFVWLYIIISEQFRFFGQLFSLIIIYIQYVQGVQETVCFSQFTATPPSHTSL